MQILFYRRDVDPLAPSAPIAVRGRMQRLVDVVDEMNQKREVPGGAHFVVTAIVKALRARTRRFPT
jgi:hypothetical protein